MQTVPINITGGTYQHKSKALSAQTTINLIPQKQEDPFTKSDYILESFHGKTLFASITGGKDRGMLEHKGILYKVSDTILYSVDSTGAETSLGTIAGVDRCILVGLGDSVIVVANGVPYHWNGSTLTTITDSDLQTPNSVSHLNNRIIYDGDDGKFWVSDVADAETINSLNFATAESNADDLKRTYVLNETLYLMGDKTIEPWWNSGVGLPPFDRIQNGTVPVGLAAIHSVGNTDKHMYFLGTDNHVYRMRGTSIEEVSNQALAREIEGYSLIDNSHGFCVNIDGQWMYIITFPTGNKTWVFPEGGQAFNWSSGVLGGQNTASSYAYAYRKHLVGDSGNGNIYELDPDAYDEYGSTMIKQRDTAPLHGGLVGAAGKDITISRFELIMEVGVGLLGSGQGSDPEIMLSISIDGGKTFGTEMIATIGQMTETLHKVEWFALGQFTSAIIRIRVSDPVYISIHSAAADVEVGI